MADMVSDARLRMQRRERLRQLQQQEHDLGKQAVAFRQLGEEVARARQARPVAGAVRTLAQSEATLKRAEVALTQARERVQPALRDRGPAALREAAAQAREVVGSLTGAIAARGGARPAASGSWRGCASGSTAYAGRWHPCRPSSRRCPQRSRCTTRP